MQEFDAAWRALQFGGPMVYPLLALAIIMVAILLDKAYVYWRYTRIPKNLLPLIQGYSSRWADIEAQLARVNPRHHLARFLAVIIEHHRSPPWWVESRAGDEAQLIEQDLGRGLWVLETIVTAAPLLGLLGTITGMMHAFNLIGSKGLVDPQGVTSGVAEALIATALGLLIALIALFGYNYFSRMQSRVLDEMERVGTRLVDQVRLDDAGTTPAVVPGDDHEVA